MSRLECPPGAGDVRLEQLQALTRLNTAFRAARTQQATHRHAADHAALVTGQLPGARITPAASATSNSAPQLPNSTGAGAGLAAVRQLRSGQQNSTIPGNRQAEYRSNAIGGSGSSHGRNLQASAGPEAVPSNSSTHRSSSTLAPLPFDQAGPAGHHSISSMATQLPTLRAQPLVPAPAPTRAALVPHYRTAASGSAVLTSAATDPPIMLQRGQQQLGHAASSDGHALRQLAAQAERTIGSSTVRQYAVLSTPFGGAEVQALGGQQQAAAAPLVVDRVIASAIRPGDGSSATTSRYALGGIEGGRHRPLPAAANAASLQQQQRQQQQHPRRGPPHGTAQRASEVAGRRAATAAAAAGEATAFVRVGGGYRLISTWQHSANVTATTTNGTVSLNAAGHPEHNSSSGTRSSGDGGSTARTVQYTQPMAFMDSSRHHLQAVPGDDDAPGTASTSAAGVSSAGPAVLASAAEDDGVRQLLRIVSQGYSLLPTTPTAAAASRPEAVTMPAAMAAAPPPPVMMSPTAHAEPGNAAAAVSRGAAGAAPSTWASPATTRSVGVPVSNHAAYVHAGSRVAWSQTASPALGQGIMPGNQAASAANQGPSLLVEWHNEVLLPGEVPMAQGTTEDAAAAVPARPARAGNMAMPGSLAGHLPAADGSNRGVQPSLAIQLLTGTIQTLREASDIIDSLLGITAAAQRRPGLLAPQAADVMQGASMHRATATQPRVDSSTVAAEHGGSTWHGNAAEPAAVDGSASSSSTPFNVIFDDSLLDAIPMLISIGPSTSSSVDSPPEFSDSADGVESGSGISSIGINGSFPAVPEVAPAAVAGGAHPIATSAGEAPGGYSSHMPAGTVSSSPSTGSTTTTTTTNNNNNNNNSCCNMSCCVVCLDEPRNVLLLPCKHLVLCGGCFARLAVDALSVYGMIPALLEIPRGGGSTGSTASTASNSGGESGLWHLDVDDEDILQMLLDPTSVAWRSEAFLSAEPAAAMQGSEPPRASVSRGTSLANSMLSSQPGSGVQAAGSSLAGSQDSQTQGLPPAGPRVTGPQGLRINLATAAARTYGVSTARAGGVNAASSTAHLMGGPHMAEQSAGPAAAAAVRGTSAAPAGRSTNSRSISSGNGGVASRGPPHLSSRGVDEWGRLLSGLLRCPVCRSEVSHSVSGVLAV